METQFQTNTQHLAISNSDGDLWGRLNAAYNTSERVGDFQADFYWPTKERRLPEKEMVVEIIGGKFHTENEPRLHFYLRLPDINKTAIKSCRLAPESMRFLRMDMERLGIKVDDVRKLGEAITQLSSKPVQARLYFNTKTGWQDMDFMGLVAPSSHAATTFPEKKEEIDINSINWGY